MEQRKLIGNGLLPIRPQNTMHCKKKTLKKSIKECKTVFKKICKMLTIK